LSDTARVEVLAKNRLASPAVEAVVALEDASESGTWYHPATQATDRNADICHDAVAELKILDVLAHLDDLADRLVARDERELGDELAFVDVCVCAADAAARDLEEDVVVAALGDGHLPDLELVGLAVVKCAHGSLGHGDYGVGDIDGGGGR
jgi:hypothetical protein